MLGPTVGGGERGVEILRLIDRPPDRIDGEPAAVWARENLGPEYGRSSGRVYSTLGRSLQCPKVIKYLVLTMK